jgi:two-component system, OmpR family, sensor histidine kinase KdpD
VAAVTFVLWMLRLEVDKAHMALAYLLVVLAASARQGRRLAMVLSVICFLCFNFFLLPPYYTFVIHDPLDWGVLIAFLLTGAVAAQLLYRAKREAQVAHERAEEIDRLSTLGAETLNAARAEQALEAIARVIQSALRIGACEVYLHEPGRAGFRRVAHSWSSHWPDPPRREEMFERVVHEGVVAVERIGGADPVTTRPAAGLAEVVREFPDARVLLLPLQVRGTAVGILRLADHDPIRLDPAQARFAEVLAYYAALGVERLQLSVEVEHVEALREADRLKEALMAGLSHDLRTPLTAIKALAHELRTTGDERAITIEEEADRLNALVTNLLDLSRLNAGALPVTLEIAAAEDLVGAALRQVSGALNGHEIRVSLKDDGEILLGRFDFAHALRSLVNLLENALKYSPSRTPVEVTVRRIEQVLAFEVADRGPGISPAETTRIFEPFYRPPGTEPDVAGTGLGLAIARRLAEAQGGSVRHDPRPDGGSRFTLALQAVDLAELADTDPE